MNEKSLSWDDCKDSTKIKYSGHSSGHGDQIQIGFIHSGKYTSNYYILIFNDGYPNPFGGGGFAHLLPKTIFEDINMCYTKLTEYIEKEYSDFEICDRRSEKDFIEGISIIKDVNK